MNKDGYVPKDIFDCAAIERAEQAGYPTINDALPQLLEWVQDINWPVAKPSAALLSKAGVEIVPVIKKVLASNDGIWKYWVLDRVIANLTADVFDALREDCARLAHFPSDDDQLEDVHTKAAEILGRNPPG